MKTTINQLKTFYNNHPLKNALERSEKIYFEVYEFGKYEEMIQKYSKLEIKLAYNRSNALRKQISKDVHRRFNDLERYLNINALYHKYNLPKVVIFDKYTPYYSVQIALNGNTYLSISNPLEHNADIVIKNQIKNVQEIPQIVKREFKKLFFANGKGKFAQIQILADLSKSQLLKRLQEDKNYKQSEYYDEEQDFYCMESTRKSLKRNLGLVFNEYQSIDFIRKAVNKIGNINKGKKAKPVFSFDTSNIDTSEDIDTLEESYYNEFYKQSQNAILI